MECFVAGSGAALLQAGVANSTTADQATAGGVAPLALGGVSGRRAKRDNGAFRLMFIYLFKIIITSLLLFIKRII